jgi:hypothetical protein
LGPSNVFLVEFAPGQLPAELRDLIATPSQILLGGEKIASGFEPFFAR